MLNAFINNMIMGINKMPANTVSGILNFFAVSGKSPVLTSDGINK
jgi:hypothetical protein